MGRPESHETHVARVAFAEMGDGALTVMDVARAIYHGRLPGGAALIGSGRREGSSPVSIGPAEMRITRQVIAYLQRTGEIYPAGSVPGRTRPHRRYISAEAARRMADRTGTQIQPHQPGARQRQREIVDQLLLAWGV